jgi:hypothetical protein
MKPLATKFCECIKSVRKTVKLRPGLAKQKSKAKAKEAAAIAICTKSVLQTRGKTLKRFSCKKKKQLFTRKVSSV